jgi:hypothetical protein
MPYYELWIEEGNRTLDTVHASNPNHAVAIYGQQLELRLTLEDLNVGAYRMLRETSHTEARLADRRPTISVWSKGPR